VLELREHTEHLQHHPPRGRAGVKRLRRRTQDDAVPVEFFGELGELAHLPAEPVDAVAEQQVHASLARMLKCALQPGPVELRAGRLVLFV